MELTLQGRTALVTGANGGLGNWPAEWDTLPQIVCLAGGALDVMAETVSGLEVDAERMLANLDLSKGQVLAEAVQMALAPALGRDVAHKLVGEAAKRASREDRRLKDLLREDEKVRALISDDGLDRLFDPINYLGAANAFIDRALADR